MKTVIYVCVPVPASNGLYRRIRLVIDGMKVTSISHPETKWDHESCYHHPTVNEYVDCVIDYASGPGKQVVFQGGGF